MVKMGFSTGALAYGDFRRGIALQAGRGLNAIELSALRDVELAPLVDAFDDLDLTGFEYVAVHAPSRITTLTEQEVASILRDRVPPSWPIVVHPDIVRDFAAWRPLGSRMCLENMDQRKAIGRTADELRRFFQELPEAGLCLDVAHARQVDPTMSVAYRLIERYRERIVQIHVSDVNDESRHVTINAASIAAYRRIAPYLPDCPWIIESVIRPSEIDSEIVKVRLSFLAEVPAGREGSLVES